MGQIGDVQDDLNVACERLFGEQGRLATAIDGFVARPGQQALAAAIADAVSAKDVLVAEAGTGTGKTFAYLVPCLVSGKKTIISTATKTLQDQLYARDLPLLLRALGLAARIQILKGRSNYLCRYRTELHTQTGRYANKDIAGEIREIHSLLPRLVRGERSELPQFPEDSPVWPWVTSTADNCLGGECPQFNDCFLVKARRKALKADVVVINHHVFFADAKIRDEGFGELLPGAEIMVFDEAHQLPEVAEHFYGVRIGTRQIKALVEDIIREWPVLDAPNHPLQLTSMRVDAMLDDLYQAAGEGGERASWERCLRVPAFTPALEALHEGLKALAGFAESVSNEKHAGFVRCEERLTEACNVLSGLLVPESTAIRWVESHRKAVVLHETPASMATSIQETLRHYTAAWIYTSATLAVRNSFAGFLRAMGIAQAKTAIFPSPFDYRKQAMLYLPRSLPDPKSERYEAQLVERVLPLVQALGGRTFLLFTSHRALRQVANLLENRMDFPLLVQGDESRTILLERFRALGNAVLLGTSTFWEGIDVRGEALSCVIIDKLPFASPADPLEQGKIRSLKAQGLSPFDDHALPAAILALKQGVGRLIRDTSDCGVLMIADPRLTGRSYGGVILESLPDMARTRDEQRVLQFIQEVVLASHESVSD